jgi:hypothetical protein
VKITLDETKSYNIPITLAIWNYTGATGNGEAVMSYNEGWAITINAYQFNIADGSITEARLANAVKQKLNNPGLSLMRYYVGLQLLPGGEYGQSGDTTKNYPYIVAKLQSGDNDYVGYNAYLSLISNATSGSSNIVIIPSQGSLIEVGVIIPPDWDGNLVALRIDNGVSAFYDFFNLTFNVIAATRAEMDKIPSEYFAETAPSIPYIVQEA